MAAGYCPDVVGAMGNRQNWDYQDIPLFRYLGPGVTVNLDMATDLFLVPAKLPDEVSLELT
jgi:hypothetical protein